MTIPTIRHENTTSTSSSNTVLDDSLEAQLQSEKKKQAVNDDSTVSSTYIDSSVFNYTDYFRTLRLSMLSGSVTSDDVSLGKEPSTIIEDDDDYNASKESALSKMYKEVESNDGEKEDQMEQGSPRGTPVVYKGGLEGETGATKGVLAVCTYITMYLFFFVIAAGVWGLGVGIPTWLLVGKARPLLRWDSALGVVKSVGEGSGTAPFNVWHKIYFELPEEYYPTTNITFRTYDGSGKAGDTVDVLYNPDDPQDAVLEDVVRASVRVITIALSIAIPVLSFFTCTFFLLRHVTSCEWMVQDAGPDKPFNHKGHACPWYQVPLGGAYSIITTISKYYVFVTKPDLSTYQQCGDEN